MAEQSTRKTGNEPVGGTDPGGTRPKPGSGATPSSTGKDTTQPDVKSGDQNDNPKRP